MIYAATSRYTSIFFKGNKVALFTREKRKYLAAILLFVIIFAGAFLRVFHFSDWLHFELDQSRDAKIISWSVENGIETLPLLGPRAAGTFLRLGPVFYYFEYIGAKIFGNTPPGMAALMLIFGILAIPLFYIFIKRFFSREISLSLSAIFATSLFLIMYSRFAWNPNTLPFFVMLFMYALLRTVDPDDKRRVMWLIVAAAAFAIATQLHFLAFVSLPVVAVVFLLIKRPRLKLAAWVGAISIILIIYSPVIINDLKIHGENTQEFIEAVTGKSEKNTHNIVEKAIRDYTENSLSYFLVVSSLEKPELPKVDLSLNAARFVDVKCDQSCRDNLPLGAVAFLLFTASIVLLSYELWTEKNTNKRDFLTLNAVLFIVSFGVFLIIAYDISPRFFLLIAPLPFIFMGLIASYLMKKIRGGKWVAVLILILLLFSNIFAISKRFKEMADASRKPIQIDTDKILKEKDRVTYEQQKMIVEYMESFYSNNGYPVFLNSESYYRRAFLYHLDHLGIPRDDLRNNQKKIYRNGNYFLIYRTTSNYGSTLEKYLNDFNLAETKTFGTLTILRLMPKEESVTDIEKKIESSGRPETGPNVPKRYSWDELLSDGEDNDE